MCRTARIPSCEARCASCCVGTTSPIAKMPGTLVSMCPSTGMKPRLVATPTRSRPMPFAHRPSPDGDQRLFGGDGLRLSPGEADGSLHLPVLDGDVLERRVGEDLDSFASRGSSCSSSEISASSTGRIRGSISMTVTSVPKREKIEANSIPTAPAPTIRSDLGTASRSRISLLVRMILTVQLQAGKHLGLRAGGDEDVLRHGLPQPIRLRPE